MAQRYEEFSSNSSEPLIMSPSVASKDIRYLGRKEIWSKQVQVDAIGCSCVGIKTGLTQLQPPEMPHKLSRYLG